MTPVVRLDAARFPGAAAYVAQLPAGLDSFPACRVRGLVFEHIPREYPALAEESLPDPLGSFLRGRVGSNDWVPEVAGQIANLMVRDRFLKSDDEYLKWTYVMSAPSFEKPLMRSLMRLMSPGLLTMGAAKRWNALHTGSDISTSNVVSDGNRFRVTGSLRFPEGLYPDLFLRGLCLAFQAALELSRGRSIDVHLVGATSTKADYNVSWTQ